MKKDKNLAFDRESMDRIIAMAREERKPFEAIKNEFGIGEREVTEIMKKKFPPQEYELWKKKVTAKKAKPKVQDDDLDDLDSKYYIKNKFD
ncbi:DUF2805 domain-containing protein [Flavobacterium sp. JP2137]|uniref:DUF2805 domain-containing protein n=1 Tax=Flavobacterium sp. JP2137 TaxID=3414510 RepID=UPI003D2FB7A9